METEFDNLKDGYRRFEITLETLKELAYQIKGGIGFLKWLGIGGLITVGIGLWRYLTLAAETARAVGVR